MNMGTCLQCLHPTITRTTLRQFHRIALAMVVMTGRVTMLGLSRWAGSGGSYRTVQRFFATVIPWATRLWVFFRPQVYRPGEVYLVAGDEVVATKAGKHPQGLDRFFSSLYGKPVPGRAFFTLSLVRVQHRRSLPLGVEQGVRSDAEKAASKAKAAARKPPGPGTTRRPGRPKGSTNHRKVPVMLPPELGRIQTMLTALLQLIMAGLSVTYLGLDGHFGHHNALDMARPCGVHLIAKLRCAAALSLPYTGAYTGRGPRRKDGHTIDDDHLPGQYRTETTGEGHIQTCISQAHLLHKACQHPLQVVLIAQTNLRTLSRAHIVLLSRELELAYTALVDYYGLRCHSEVV